MFSLSLPSKELSAYIAENKRFEYKGMVFKHGTICDMETFGKEYTTSLYFDNSTGMLMFYDETTTHSFNICGYLTHVKSVYNDEFTESFGSKKISSFPRLGLYSSYIISFGEFSKLSQIEIPLKINVEQIGDKVTTVCHLDFNNLVYRIGGQLLIKPTLDKKQRELIQSDCESLFP